MPNNKVVLDTNCLLACISSKSENFRVWKDFQTGRFTLCVSNEILEEYQEIISRKATPIVADNAFAANAAYIVSDDSHFDVLKDIPFPQLLVLKLKDFLERLRSEHFLI